MRVLFLTFAAAGIAFIIDLAIGMVAVRLTRVPPDFAPFTLLPILSGAVGGAVPALTGLRGNPGCVFCT
jgi:hypothetical protein